MSAAAAPNSCSGATGSAQFSHSFPLGSVRLLETMPCSDPPKPAELAACRAWLKDFLNKEVRPRLQEAGALSQRAAPGETDPDAGSGDATRRAGDSAPCLNRAQLVGVGGTASILGCMEAELTKFDRARLEATRLPAARVSWHLERLWSLPLEQRKQIVGLPKNRADIILMGVAIYQAVMESLRLPRPAHQHSRPALRRPALAYFFSIPIFLRKGSSERLRPRNFSMDSFTSRESPGA